MYCICFISVGHISGFISCFQRPKNDFDFTYARIIRLKLVVIDDIYFEDNAARPQTQKLVLLLYSPADQPKKRMQIKQHRRISSNFIDGDTHIPLQRFWRSGSMLICYISFFISYFFSRCHATTQNYSCRRRDIAHVHFKYIRKMPWLHMCKMTKIHETKWCSEIRLFLDISISERESITSTAWAYFWRAIYIYHAICNNAQII